MIETIYCCCGKIGTRILTGKMAEKEWYSLRFSHGDPKGPRNWTEYNERLVMRGYSSFSLYWTHSMADELTEMNRGKRGAPFRYPRSMIVWARNKHAQEGKDYRSLEGELRAIMSIVGGKAVSYSQMFKRCRDLDMMGAAVDELDPKWVRLKNLENSMVPGAVPIDGAGDASGFRAAVRGEWMREKWKVRRGWVKLHALSDTRTNVVLSYSVTTEETGDARMLLAMVDDAVARGHWIKTVYIDGAYDTIKIWKGLKERGIGVVVNIRKDAATRSRNGCPQRALAARMRNGIGDKLWKTIHRYGRRWKAESVFSDLKRIFREDLKAKSMGAMVREIDSKIIVHNMNKAVIWGN